MAYEIRRLRAFIQTKYSPKIDIVELAWLCLSVWEDEQDAVTALAVAGAESGYRTLAWNVDKLHGQSDYGLFQINEIHNPTEDERYVPWNNVLIAHEIWEDRASWHSTGDGFTAWAAYNAGKHGDFMVGARQAVQLALEGHG